MPIIWTMQSRSSCKNLVKPQLNFVLYSGCVCVFFSSSFWEFNNSNDFRDFHCCWTAVANAIVNHTHNAYPIYIRIISTNKIIMHLTLSEFHEICWIFFIFVCAFALNISVGSFYTCLTMYMCWFSSITTRSRSEL